MISSFFKQFLIAVGLVIFGAWFSIIFLNSVLSEYWLTAIILILLGAILTLPFIRAIRQKSFDAFEPIYLWVILYSFLYFAKPLIQLLTHENFWSGAETLNLTILLSILGIVAFYAGYYGKLGSQLAKKIPLLPAKLSPKRLALTAWGFILLGFWGLNYYIQTSGGWLVFWQKPHGLGGQALKTTAYIYELPELMVIGFLLLVEIFLEKVVGQKQKAKFGDWSTLILGALGGVGIYTIIWGSRTLYSWIGLAIIILYFLKRGIRPTLKMALGVTLTLFIFLSAVPIYRQYVHLGSDWKAFQNNFTIKSIFRTAFNPGDEFTTYLAEVKLVPEFVPYDYFRIYTGLLIHPIPRLIWPDKPTLFNRQWDEFLPKSGLGWGSAESFLGDLYAQLGIWGIAIGSFLSGVLWKFFYAYLLQGISRRSVILLYAVVFPNMFTYLAQSAAIGILKWAPYMVPGTLLAIFLAREKLTIPSEPNKSQRTEQS